MRNAQRAREPGHRRQPADPAAGDDLPQPIVPTRRGPRDLLDGRSRKQRPDKPTVGTEQPLPRSARSGAPGATGARLSTPALDCPEIIAAKREIAAGRLRAEAADAGLVEAATTCRSRLVTAGADLNGYTSAEAADDIEDLRVALGYPQLNLYALSYGTRLALTVARRHPTSVRAMVLDSALPPQAAMTRRPPPILGAPSTSSSTAALSIRPAPLGGRTRGAISRPWSPAPITNASPSG